MRRSLLLANPAVFGVSGVHAATATTMGPVWSSAKYAVRLEEGGVADSALSRNSSAFKTTSMSVVSPAGQRVRTNFNALALFSPSLRTNADGAVRATFYLPDNLTRYRVMAIAASGNDAFGAGES